MIRRTTALTAQKSTLWALRPVRAKTVPNLDTRMALVRGTHTTSTLYRAAALIASGPLFSIADPAVTDHKNEKQTLLTTDSFSKQAYSRFQSKGMSMKFTVSLSNPFAVTAYTGCCLTIGWAIGAHWGHAITAVWMLFAAVVFLYLHDVVFAVLVAMAIARGTSSNRS
jgi:hypothetical protein